MRKSPECDSTLYSLMEEYASGRSFKAPPLFLFSLRLGQSCFVALVFVSVTLANSSNLETFQLADLDDWWSPCSPTLAPTTSPALGLSHNSEEFL